MKAVLGRFVQDADGRLVAEYLGRGEDGALEWLRDRARAATFESAEIERVRSAHRFLFAGRVAQPLALVSEQALAELQARRLAERDERAERLVHRCGVTPAQAYAMQEERGLA